MALILGFLALSAALPAWAAKPAVARPKADPAASPNGAGTAFFLATPDGKEAVGVTTAHAFDLGGLGREGELSFVLGQTGGRVSVSHRLYSEPGRPFSETGASLADDYLLFALDIAPQGVRLLEPEVVPSEDLIGVRVRLLGVGRTAPHDEDDLFGTVREASAERIEVELDTPADLRGWGGAPGSAAARWQGDRDPSSHVARGRSPAARGRADWRGARGPRSPPRQWLGKAAHCVRYGPDRDRRGDRRDEGRPIKPAADRPKRA